MKADIGSVGKTATLALFSILLRNVLILNCFLLLSGSILAGTDFPLEPLSRETPLVVDGKALGTIVYPEKDALLKGLAQKISGKITEATGVNYPIISDVQTVPKWCGPLDEKFKRMPLVILGDINKNRAVFPLYARYLCWCDGKYPGEGGYELRTVVSPYYYRSPNHLVIAAGGEKEYLIAVNEFIKKIDTAGKMGSLIIPGLLDVKLGENWKSYADSAHYWASKTNRVVNEDPDTSANVILLDVVKVYQLTGEPACAEAVRQSFLKHLAKNRDEFAASSDYGLEALARSWELSRDSGIYKPEDIRAVNQALFKGMDKLKDKYWRRTGSCEGDRHAITGTFAFMVMGQTLRRNCPDDTATARQLDTWISEAKSFFDAFAERRNWRGWPDHTSESLPVAGYILTYGFREGNLAFFESGLAKEAARHAMTLADSMLNLIGQGNYEDCQCNALIGPARVGGVLALSGFYYRDTEMKWLIENYPSCNFAIWQAQGVDQEHGYAMDSSVTSKKPEEGGNFLGVVKPPAMHDIFLSLQKDGRTDLPFEKTFDKLALRDGLNPTDKFIVLKGMECKYLSMGVTGDGNSIIRMTDQGRICLFHNNRWDSHFHRNGVLVSTGFSKPAPPVARFDSSASFKRGDFIRTSLPDYNGTTWTRSIFSLKNSLTAVFDDVQAETSGVYSATCTWRTPYASRLDGSDWSSIVNGVEFHVVSPAFLQNDTVVEPMRPGEIANRGTGLRQIQFRKLAKGDKISFRNLLYTNGELRPAEFEIRQTGEDSVIVKGQDGVSWLIGIDGIKTDAIETDATMYMIGGDTAFLSGASRLKIKGKEIWKASSRENKEINASPELAGIPYQNLWAKGQHPDFQSAPLLPDKGFWSFLSPGKEPLRHMWSYSGFRRTLKPVPGISAVTSVQADKEPLSMLFNGHKYFLAYMSDAKFYFVNGYELVMDLHGKYDIKAIRACRDQSIKAPPYPIKVEITASDSLNFRDKKPHSIELLPGVDFREATKGTVTACYFNEAGKLDFSGRYLRIRFPKEIRLWFTEIEIFTPQTTAPEFIDAAGINLADGKAVAVATAAGEIAVISTEGKRFSSKIWPGVEPYDLAASDIDGDGFDNIIFSGSDGGVHIMDKDNINEFQAPSLKELVYGILPGDWVKTGKRPIYTTTGIGTISKWLDGKDWFTKPGYVWAYDLLPSAGNSDPQGKRFLFLKDINGSVMLADAETMDKSDTAYAIAGKGRTMYWTYADLPGGKGKGLLLVNSSGFGLYRISPEGKLSAIWSHSDEVRQFCGLLTDVPGKGKRILIGRADGFIAEFDVDGKLIANHWTGWPVKSLESTVNSSGASFVFAGTDGGIACFDKEWNAAQFISGACVKLLKIRSGEKDLMFSFSNNGIMDCYSCDYKY